MANSTIPNLVAVTVPALTDLFGVRQSGDSRDKKLTVTQLLTLVPGGGDVTKVGTPVDNQIGVWTGDGTIEGDANFTWDGAHLLLPLNNDAVTPTLAFGDGDTGFYEAADDDLKVSVAGIAHWRWISSQFRSETSHGPILVDEAASATNPTLIPRNSALSTGIGSVSADVLNLISNGSNMVELKGFGTESIEMKHPVLVPLGAVGAPSLTFTGDLDTGIYSPGADILGFTVGGFELARISDISDAFFKSGTDPAADGGDLDLSSGDSGVGATGIGGDVNILSGSSVATTGDGGVVSIKSGAGFFQGAGGDMLFEVGSGGAAGPGKSGNFFVNTLVGLTADGGLQVPIPGLVSIYGVGRTGDGPAGDLELWAGYAAGSGGSAVGGDLLLFGGGQGGGAGAGGNAHLYGGESDTQPGFAEVEGGTATVGGNGGAAFVRGGPGFGTNFGGGLVLIKGGLGIGTGNGGQANLQGGNSGSGATGNAGAVDIVGGLAVSTDGDGGDVNIIGGTKSGSGTPGIISLTADGVGITWDGDSLLLPSVNDAVTPTLAFGDGDTGFYEVADDSIKVTLGGVARWTFTGDRFVAHAGNGPSLQNEASTATNPTLIPALGDVSTGIGGVTGAMDLILGSLSAIHLRKAGSSIFIECPSAVFEGKAGVASGPTYSFSLDSNTGMYSGGSGSDELKFAAGGVDGLILKEVDLGVLQAPDASVGLTANPGGGQGSASLIRRTNNVIATVATTGDSVVLPTVFLINTVVYIKNDGANAADVFPASGDDLGAGTNTAVSLAAGESISFIALVANLTWTPFIVSAGGGGGDVTKVGTPVNNQVGVWTGDGTLEGDADLLFDGTILTMGLSSRVRTGVGTTSQAAFGFTTEINTGIYRQGTGSLGITLQGAGNWLFQAASFFANVSAGPQLMFEAASATNPTFVPRLSDTDSGIGSAAADQVNLIAGGLSCMSVRETGSARQIGFYVTAPISLQTGVGVDSASIHAALVALGLITA